MLLRDSEYIGELDYRKVIKLAKEFRGRDLNGYRAEFIGLIEKAELIENN